MNILVVGSSGVFGTSFIKMAQKADSKMTIIAADILEDSNELENFYKIDITDKQELQKIFKENKIDGVVYAAGLNVLDNLQNYSVSALFQCNVMAFISVLDLMVEYHIPLISLPSSEYALGLGGLYGATKRAMEDILIYYSDQYSFIQSLILRVGSVFSDSQFSNNYLFQLINQLLNEETIKISPDSIRNMIHVDDISQFMLDSIFIQKNSKILNQPINLKTNLNMSKNELLLLLEEVFGVQASTIIEKKSSVRYTRTPLRIYNIKDVVLSENIPLTHSIEQINLKIKDLL